MDNIYEADVSPIGSAFDRACELYQLIIGVVRVQAICSEKGFLPSEAVYGKSHVEKEHKNTFYKFRYLKSFDPSTKKMLAYPNGIPGVKDINKLRIHFVGHSMGAITVRYLQYLLKTGYFDDIAGNPKQDRSSMIFSLTCLSGANNGSLVVNNCGL